MERKTFPNGEDKNIPKHIPNPLFKKILSYNEDCEAITSKGKRCSKSFKYQYKDEVRNCGKYCASHCKSWIYSLLKTLIKGTLIINGNVDYRVTTQIKFGHKAVRISYYEINGENPIDRMNSFPVIRSVNEFDKKYERGAGKNSEKSRELLNKVIQEMGDFICANKSQIGVVIIPSYTEEIKDLEVGGIRGWTVSKYVNENKLSKYYNLSHEL